MDNTETSNFLHQVLSADLTGYMKTIGLDCVGKKNGMAYYMSPFRKREFGEPGLVVDTKKQLWRCNDSGLKGNIIDLAAQVFKIKIPEVLDHLRANLVLSENATDHPDALDLSRFSNLHATNESNITDKRFFDFFEYHGMTVPFVEQYLAQYECTDKTSGEKLTAVGLHTQDKPGHLLLIDDSLPTKAGYLGSEVSDHVGFAFCNNYRVEVDVFTSLMDMLHLKNLAGPVMNRNNTLILTDDFSFEKARILMEAHKQVNLFLPNTHRANQYKGYAEWLSPKYRDYSHTYSDFRSISQLMNQRFIEFWNHNLKQRKKGPDGL